MGQFNGEQPHRLVENFLAPEFWYDGIAKIEKVGRGVFRVYLYRVRKPLNDEGATEHEIVAVLLTDFAHVNASMRMVADAVGSGAVVPLQ